ncbi:MULTISPECIES: DUF2000 family protein [Thalassospira]|jgi:hypothetical protein|uniref:DUF2000 domain-containing protein n=1 Tax=Thalassospira lucentensis TaxID=168935 RepID=A0A358HQ99_9PROT|nr:MULTISPECIES: DUF2000 family protein [Thalassospira]MBV18230.1 DUF2000 domain-containing protein [Thalassospira sp.]RCK29062.1 hypothetical protein TH1_08110 [Thalassospira lucentensis MCCC 1A00383 = DSM 14000]HBU97152.1 DUF2000 domain-containing protein [Thalassospira lucentensis]HCW67041.1 DUF2000 domain-containing protein [Thalassospira lucentensis]|tara:strand:+ start:121414 stop:121821 length:408 start_codon:yes stop_codon:yes gene_type:complete
MFETKVALVLRDDLQMWQSLNVTAFLMSGIVAQTPDIIGEPYVDAKNNLYNPLSRQPAIVLAADAQTIAKIHQRAINRGIRASAYIEEMFATGHDGANRDVFARLAPDDAQFVGIGIHADKRIVDKITKGAKMHP